MKKFFIILLALILIVLIVLLSYSDDEQKSSYKNLQAVKSDTAIERGWVPAILPPLAHDIEVTHNLDTNVFYGSFYYKEEDETNFLKHLTLVEESDNTYSWKDILFHIDKKSSKVWYRNKAD